MFSFKKSFSFSFKPLKRQNYRICALLKSMNVRNQIWKKTYFEPKLLETIIFYHFFTTKQTLNQKFWNVSVFERNFNNSNSSNLESKLVQHVRFRTKTSYYPSEFESNILQCFRFWRKIFCGKSKFFAKIALKKTISLDRLTL